MFLHVSFCYNDDNRDTVYVEGGEEEEWGELSLDCAVRQLFFSLIIDPQHLFLIGRVCVCVSPKKFSFDRTNSVYEAAREGVAKQLRLE